MLACRGHDLHHAIDREEFPACSIYEKHIKKNLSSAKCDSYTVSIFLKDDIYCTSTK